MVQYGKVISLNRKDKTGIIQNLKGVRYFFSVNECSNNKLPHLLEKVSFVRDPDFKSTEVAILVVPTSH